MRGRVCRLEALGPGSPSALWKAGKSSVRPPRRPVSERKQVGVVLFQLGGPDSTAAVEPFLYNLFCDPDIIDFFGAWFARRPLARWIARKRAGVVRAHYDAIGGHSP